MGLLPRGRAPRPRPRPFFPPNLSPQLHRPRARNDVPRPTVPHSPSPNSALFAALPMCYAEWSFSLISESCRCFASCRRPVNRRWTLTFATLYLFRSQLQAMSQRLHAFTCFLWPCAYFVLPTTHDGPLNPSMHRCARDKEICLALSLQADLRLYRLAMASGVSSVHPISTASIQFFSPSMPSLSASSISYPTQASSHGSMRRG